LDRGLVVRGTFINAPAEWFDLTGSASRRSLSSPPASGLDWEDDDFGVVAARSPRGRRRAALKPDAADSGAKARELSPSTQSVVSTHCDGQSPQSLEAESPPGADRCQPQSDAESDGRESVSSSATPELNLSNPDDLWWLGAEDMNACKGTALRIVGAVERECAFLRLNGHVVHAQPSDKARRQGMAMNLRFYVRGLPSAKRAKWQQPLCWSVAAVLQRVGLPVQMRGGELYGAVREGVYVRLEFVSGRL
jgi:hypothetical protein